MSLLQSWFLNLVYATMIVLGSPWLLWRYRKGKNRRGWTQKLFGRIDLPLDFASIATGENNELIWIHAVSVGEVNLLGAILADLAQRDVELLSLIHI